VGIVQVCKGEYDNDNQIVNESVDTEKTGSRTADQVDLKSRDGDEKKRRGKKKEFWQKTRCCSHGDVTQSLRLRLAKRAAGGGVVR